MPIYSDNSQSIGKTPLVKLNRVTAGCGAPSLYDGDAFAKRERYRIQAVAQAAGARAIVDDPGRWGPWVAPCPVGEEEINRKKDKRRRKSRMDARTRERLPVLPVVVRTVDDRRKAAAALLEAGRQARPGEPFAVGGRTLVRSTIGPRSSSAHGKVWADDPVTGKRRNLSLEESNAFWAWAIVEVLRATGIRAEELLEHVLRPRCWRGGP